MLPRILRSLTALATIVVAYQVYVWLAVPLLEPPLAAHVSHAVTDKEREAAAQSTSKYQRLLANYFPREHWTQERPPIVLTSGPSLLVLDPRYERFDDGRVNIRQFAILVFPTPIDESGTAPRDAIIIEAPQGAALRFDKNFRPERAEVGQITRGTFPGPISIRSDMNEPGPQDDLLIETAELEMTPKLLYSQQPVRFRMGSNVGAGRELEIRLLEGPDARSNKIGVASLEIIRDVHVRVDLKADSLLPSDFSKIAGTSGSQTSPGNAQAANESSRGPTPPVDITCTGPFHFDFVRYVASFDQNVKIRQLSAIGPGDSLDANQLDIHFSPKAPPVGGPPVPIDPNQRQQAELGRLEPSLIVAQGEPVVVVSPRLKAEARAQQVRLHLLDRRVTLDGGRDTVLVYGSSVLKAPAIDYWHPPSDAATKIGRFRATGPGSLFHVPDPQKPNEGFQAVWQTSVELGRSNGQPVFVLTGRPQLGMANAGSLTADQLSLTLRELQLPKIDNDSMKLQLLPDLLNAIGRVEVVSPKLTALTEHLTATFIAPAAPRADPIGATPLIPSTANASSAIAPLAAAAPQGLAAQLGRPATSENPTSAYRIETDRLQLGVFVRGRDAAPSTVDCLGNVVFREIPLVPTDKQPFEFRGHQLTAGGLDVDAARIKIIGADLAAPSTTVYASQRGGPHAGWVQLAGRGITFHTAAVEIDQRENRLWSEGPGVATILITRDFEGRATTEPNPIEIRWEDGMTFDGRSATFRGNIQGQAPDDAFRCRQLVARLAAPIDFNSPKTGGEKAATDVAEIEFQEQVIINHRSRDEGGPISHDRLQLELLTINLKQTGNISGRGPGVIRSTRFGSATGGFGNLAALGTKPAAGAPPAADTKLVFLRTDFDGPLTGNLHTRMLQISDRVRAVMGPVDSWEQELDGNRPDSLPAKSLMIECEVLRANEDPMAARALNRGADAKTGQFGAIQLHAERNVRIDGRSAGGARMRAEATTASYDRSKETILIKGAPAVLWLQAGPGEHANPVRVNDISYSLETGMTNLTGVQGIEIMVPQRGQNPPASAAPQSPFGPRR